MALEAGRVLFLTLVEAGPEVVITPPQVARQVEGRFKADRPNDRQDGTR